MENNNSKICFILLPGLAPDAFPVQGLKAVFEDRGYSVIAVGFFGNGPVKDFSKLTARLCVENIQMIAKEASAKYDAVFGIGISLGGAFLLECAKENELLDGIVSIGTPFRLRHRKLFGLAQKICPFIYPAWKQFQKIKPLRLIPIGAGNMAIDFFEGKFLQNLDRINTPVLFLHSKKDDVTDFNALSEYVPKLENAKSKITFFDNGNHVIDDKPEVILEHAINYFGLNRAESIEEVSNNSPEMELCPEKIQTIV